MKIIKIEMIGFGRWQNDRIDFLPGNQLIYGANEAGKSTIYQFMQAMLFGFPSKGRYKKDYTPRQGGSYGGRMWIEHPVHGVIKIERFKEQKRGQAKVFYQDQVGDDQLLAQLLHPLTKELFQSIFTFQQEQLAAVNQVGEEELQTLLLSLGLSGSQQLLNSKENYAKSAQKLYKNKGSQPLLNQKFLAYQEIQEKINAKEATEHTFKALEQQLKQVRSTLSDKREEALQIKEEQRIVEQQLLNYPLYHEWQQLKRQPSQGMMPKADQEVLYEAFQQVAFVKEELNHLNEELTTVSPEQEEDEAFQFYMKEYDFIQQLLKQRYDLEKSVDEMAWMKQTLVQNQEEMRVLEARWHWRADAPPHLFFDVHTLKAQQKESEENEAQLQRTYSTLQFLEEDIAASEANLSMFEAENRELFRKNRRKAQQKSYLFLLIASGVAFALSMVLPAAARLILWGVSALLLLSGAGLLLRRPIRSLASEKKQWQEKLSHVDYLNDKKRQQEQLLKQLQEQKQQRLKKQKQLAKKYGLGAMDQLTLWFQHRDEITRYLLLLNTNKELEQQLTDLDAQLQVTLQQTALLSPQLPLENQSLKEQLGIIRTFADQMEQVRFAKEYRADAYIRQRVAEQREKQQSILLKVKPLLSKWGLRSLEEVPQRIQENQQRLAQETRKQELQILLGDMYPNLVSQAELDVQKQSIQQKEMMLEEAIFHLQKQEQQLLYQRQQMVDDYTLDDLYQELAMQQSEIEELALQWSGYQVAGQLLMDLLTELSDQQLPMLMENASLYFQLLTEDLYQRIQIQEEQLVVMRRDGELFQPHELSTGTKDQLIMAIRFGFLYLQEQRYVCPIIIDDGWLHYDHHRKYQLTKLLEKFGEKQQVICFSSDMDMVANYRKQQQPIIELKGVSV